MTFAISLLFNGSKQWWTGKRWSPKKSLAKEWRTEAKAAEIGSSLSVPEGAVLLIVQTT